MIEITLELVEELIKEQFPIWNNLKVKPIEKSGHDNRTFYLGKEMTVRLPSGEDYVPQIEKEMEWLPKLQPFISLPISSPIAKGEPSIDYPFPWSINRYIIGETASYKNISDLKQFATDLADFLRELQNIDTTDAPVAGKHNFYRGANLGVYHDETEIALYELKDILPTDDLRVVWNRAISSEWTKEDVWLHGDIAPGNLLVSDGQLCGVIDFGIMSIGDPACDYAMAWTFFNEDSRKEFLKTIDTETINRARGWALWKALITYNEVNLEVRNNARFTIQTIINEII